MGDMSNIYDKSSSKNDACPATDDMSLFLHQILLRSSSSSSSTLPSSSLSFMAPEMQSTYSAALVNDSAFGFADLSVGGSSTIVGPNVSSSSVGGGVVSENETDDCDCESEEGLEALVEEVPAKSVAGRSSSKRSRAAEVHNLSEKRRRSRINEKMKALQNLIPNSNKTDKASMLDEAIEYLKQLQLQVQMLSMRNGISLHPMCVPVMLQPIRLSQLRLGFGEESVPRHLNMTTSLPLTQETPSRPTFNFPDQCTASNQLSLPNMADIMSTDTSFGVRSAIQAHFGPFPLNTSSEARDVKQLCREEVLLSQQLNSDHAQSNTSEFEMGAAMRVSLPYERQGSSLDAHIMGREQTEGVFLKNMDQKHMLSSALNGRKSEETVIERPYI